MCWLDANAGKLQGTNYLKLVAQRHYKISGSLACINTISYGIL